MPVKKIKSATVRLIRDDITTLDVQAFVYYAQHDLKLGSGFGNAIMARGGPSIQAELDKVGRLETCQSVVTGAGDLAAEYIIHAVGPRFQEPDTEKKLRETTLEVLKKADEKGIERIALPPMGTGFYGVPLAVSAAVTLGAVKEHLEGDTKLAEVVICLNDHREMPPFEAQLNALN